MTKLWKLWGTRGAISLLAGSLGVVSLPVESQAQEEEVSGIESRRDESRREESPDQEDADRDQSRDRDQARDDDQRDQRDDRDRGRDRDDQYQDRQDQDRQDQDRQDQDQFRGRREREPDRRFDEQFQGRQAERGERGANRAQLGIYVRSAQDGVQVVTVDPNSPAAKAGIRRGDFVASVDGRVIEEPEQVSEIVSRMREGDQVDLVVWRNGQRMRARATLASGDASGFREGQAFRQGQQQGGSFRQGAQRAFSQHDQQAWLGVALKTKDTMDSDEESSDEQNKEEDKIAEITLVYPTSPAAIAGLKTGDKIVAADDKTFESAHDLTHYIQDKQPGEEVTLKVESEDEDEPQEVKVKLASKLDYIAEEGRNWDENNPLYSIPEHLIRMEHDRQMAECNKRMEELLLQTLKEVRDLKEEVAALKKEKSESE